MHPASPAHNRAAPLQACLLHSLLWRVKNRTGVVLRRRPGGLNRPKRPRFHQNRSRIAVTAAWLLVFPQIPAKVKTRSQARQVETTGQRSEVVSWTELERSGHEELPRADVVD